MAMNPERRRSVTFYNPNRPIVNTRPRKCSAGCGTVIGGVDLHGDHPNDALCFACPEPAGSFKFGGSK